MNVIEHPTARQEEIVRETDRMKVLFDRFKEIFLGKGEMLEGAVELASIRRTKFLEFADSRYGILKIPSEDNKWIEVCEVTSPNEGGIGYVMWEIATDIGKKYLYANLSKRDNGEYDSEHWVVAVKARYFYAIWLAGLGQKFGNSNYPPPIEKIFLNNHKGYDSEKIWTIENPVKIPKIGPDFALFDYCHLRFSNGQHRVLWLLSKGVRVFPVEVRTQKAALELHSLVGMEDHPPVKLQNFHSEILDR